MWDWSYWPMPHFFFDPLFMIVFLVCMIMMMWVMRGHRYGGSHALDILNERYARGEIIKPNTKSDGACWARPKDSASADRHDVHLGVARLLLFFNGTVIWGLVQSSRVLVLKRFRRFEGGTDVQTYSDSDRRI